MPTRPMSPAERMKRLRARRKAGLMVVPVEIGERDLDALEARGLLEKNESDPAEIARAVRAGISR